MVYQDNNNQIKITEELLDAYIKLYPAWEKKHDFWLVKLKKSFQVAKTPQKKRGAYNNQESNL